MEVQVQLDSVKKIIHCGDIHIRNLKRHREYKQVFNRFYKKIKKHDLTDTLIYVAGDIAHAKSEMSPELVREISRFFNKLANLAPTIIICGNHDANLNNSSRLDVLTPIVDALNNPNLFYFKDSGVYKVADVTFVVMSVFDSVDTYIKAKDVDGEIKIALFHGTLHDSKTDIGYVIRNRSIMIDMFDGFDLVLLGDIHKAQTLQEYSIQRNEIDEKDLQKYLDDGWEVDE